MNLSCILPSLHNKHFIHTLKSKKKTRKVQMIKLESLLVSSRPYTELNTPLQGLMHLMNYILTLTYVTQRHSCTNCELFRQDISKTAIKTELVCATFFGTNLFVMFHISPFKTGKCHA